MERVGTGGLVGKVPVVTTGRQGSRLQPVASALDAQASPMVGSLQQTIGVASQAAALVLQKKTEITKGISTAPGVSLLRSGRE